MGITSRVEVSSSNGGDVRAAELWGSLVGATSLTVALLIDGAFEALENLTQGRRFSAEELRSRLEGTGVLPFTDGDGWEEALEVAPVAGAALSFDVLAPLWTEEGSPELTVELRLVHDDDMAGYLEKEILDIGPHPRQRPHPPRPVPRPRIWQRNEPPVPTDDARPIPQRWRPAIAEVAHRLVLGDFRGLARDGFVSYTEDPSDDSIGCWIEEYGATLIDPPDEAWDSSSHGEINGLPTTWWFEINLWTVEEGYSDLTVEGTVHDDGAIVTVKLDGIHVM